MSDELRGSAGAAADVDLTNCDREPIHIPGRVQAYGCLVATSTDWIVSRASSNCADILGLPVKTLLGARFADMFPNQTSHDLRSRMQAMGHEDTPARLFAYDLFADGRHFDVSIHTVDRQLIFEFEPRQGPVERRDDATLVRSLIARIERKADIVQMSREAARAMRLLTGFDRVMVYRFGPDGSGSVIAEALDPGMEPFLGLNFPASDIPRQARALYERNILRIIADVHGQTHAIEPELGPDGAPLDLSMAVTRAVSPIHLEYLSNMGVGASMSVSILRRGKLWGLFACHHNKARYLDFERRSAVELFAQLFNYALTQTETEQEMLDIDAARKMHDRIMARMSSGATLADTFETFADQIAEVIPHDGIALWADGVYKATGAAPTREEFSGLARFLNGATAAQVLGIENLAARYPNGEDMQERVAGLLAIPVSRTPRDYLVLFRREIARSVTWAGDPAKPVTVGPNGARLTPRKSFEAWKEVVRGHSAPWKASEMKAAEALRVTLMEVVLKMADEADAARRRADQQKELLIAELNHRVRNILNLIQGLVSQGGKSERSLEDFSSTLDARIHALARAHDLLTRNEWDWVSLQGLIETEIKAFALSNPERVWISGDVVDLSPTAFTTLALVIHEMTTNSVKYGALGASAGGLTVEIELQEDGAVQLLWSERGGPPVSAPNRSGFGTAIIERSIPFELQGSAILNFRPTGLEARFLIPARHVRPGAAHPVPDKAPVDGKDAPGAGRALGEVLLVEDNMIIALDASDMLTDLGAGDVHIAANVTDALHFLDQRDIAFAVLDVNLGTETSVPVAEACAASGIPFVLATGYGASADVVDRYAGADILRKPYSSDDLARVLRKAGF